MNINISINININIKLQNIIKRKNIIEHIFISPILIRLILLADAENPNIYNINDIADYKNIIRFIFEYSEKGGSEKHAEFRYKNIL